jgi:hypothetical protein
MNLESPCRRCPALVPCAAAVRCRPGAPAGRRAGRQPVVRAVGGALCRHPAAVDRPDAAGRAVFLAPPFRQDRRGWALAFLLPFALVFGPATAGAGLVHALLAEYIPFILLLTALFTVSGGIYIRGNLHGTPLLNTGICWRLGRAGQRHGHHRRVDAADPPADPRQRQPQAAACTWWCSSSSSCNIGGSLTPLGDPPLFLGFLKGVDFFWTVKPHPARHAVSDRIPADLVLPAGFLVLPSQQGSPARRPDPRHPAHRF